ncbi:HNH endonuclease [Bacillus cereus]|uniref:HNH endonuclease n=1 Tax=Bacillus cereus TaxID=1396 RepID=UPI0024B734B9|nr:HNH endonuclease [Bacillus cereus]
MSLNMYLGEVQSQTQSMNAICNATIQSMEQAIQSIDAFAIDTVLQGQTYSSAKAYLVQTFRPLAQGIICLCEELIRQNEAFPNDFQAKVASTDVIEHEIRQQIQEINQSIASIEAIEVLTPMPGVDAIIAVLIAMRKKLEEKLERLYEFNHSSSNNYSTALQLAASITAGLAEVQSGKGFSPVSGTFSTQGLNMDWVSSIQGIIEETARKNNQSIKDIETNNIIEEKSPVRNAWDDATDSIVGTFETAKKMWEAIQRGSGKAVGDEIESAIALSNMDIGTFINVTYALFHLDETAKNMWHAFSNKIKRDMIEGDTESRTELTTYGLTQIATTILGDRGLNKVGHITKGAKASSGLSTFANAVKLAKELKPTLEMLQSFKKEASYAFSNVGGTIITKIPHGELIEAYYKFAKSKDGGKGTGNSSKIVNEANLNNIDEFINGTKKFDDVINDYVKLYSEKIISNKTWSWNKSLHGGANLTARQKRMIKEKAVADGLVPDVKVIKADGMRYGFADFKSAGLVVETKQLPERLWLMSDEEQFKWLDNAIGGRPEGMTWHHTEVPGKMELVPFGIHNITIHNGGRSAGMWADAPR